MVRAALELTFAPVHGITEEYLEAAAYVLALGYEIKMSNVLESDSEVEEADVLELDSEVEMAFASLLGMGTGMRVKAALSNEEAANLDLAADGVKVERDIIVDYLVLALFAIEL